jgi:hypothetical protein
MANKFKVEVKGIKEFTRAVEVQAAKLDKASERIVKKGSAIVGRFAKKEFRPRPLGSQRISASGRVYYATNGRFAPQPPKPTSRTGNLRNSIHMVQAERLGPASWMSTTAPSVVYGARVELGGGPNRPFPYMKPGFDKSVPELQRLYNDEWAAALS